MIKRMTSVHVKRVFSLVLAYVVFITVGLKADTASLGSEYSTFTEDCDLSILISAAEATHELECAGSLLSNDAVSMQSLSVSIDYDDEFDDSFSCSSDENGFFQYFFDPSSSQYRSVQYNRVKLFLLYSSPKLPSGSVK